MSKLITELYKSRNILLNQLERQGFDTKDVSGCSLQEINIMNDKDQLNMLLQKTTGEKVYVSYKLNDGKQLTSKIINEQMKYYNSDEDDDIDEELKLDKKDSLIIISINEMNESLTKRVKEYWDMYEQYVTIINLNRLQYNVLDHTLVPHHSVIRDKDRIDEIKKKYHIDEDEQFPTISRFDPVAQAIGLRPGELCEIVRPSKTAITTLYYRMCVNM